MPSPRQSSFAAGEVMPEFYGRTSDPRYLQALRTCENFLPLPHGGMKNRAGCQLVYGDGLDQFSFSQGRLVSFIFSDQSTAVLIFTNLTVSFVVSGRLLETSVGSNALYQVTTPYVLADLARLKFAQSGDVVTITHPNYAPMDLSRLALRSWTLAASALGPVAGFYPASVSMAANGFAGDNATAYNGAHLYSSGDYVNDGTSSYIALLANTGKAPSTNPNYWVLAVDASHVPRAWSWVVTARWQDSKGVIYETLPTPAPANAFTVLETDRPCVINFTAPANPGFPYKLVGYGIYRGRNGLFGWIDDADPTALTYKDDAQAPDFSIQPPQGTNPFKIADGNNTNATLSYPAVVAYHEQRRMYAGSPAKPNHFQGSAIGNFADFDPNLVQQLDSDAFDFGVSSQRLEDIRSAVSQDQFVMLTGQSVFTAEGAPGKGITPTSVRLRRNGKHGASYLQPLEAEETIIFNTAKGNHIRDLTYSFQVGKLTGTDLTRIARHLFTDFTVVDWCYCEEPYPIIWVVRSDGMLLSCTYDREAQVVAWAQHPTGIGTIESVCSVPEGTEDVVYLIRNYDGNARRIERMASLSITDLRYAVFLDAAVVFDGHWHSGEIKITGASYNALDQVSIGCQTTDLFIPGVNSSDIGDRIVLDPDGLAGGPFLITVTQVISGSSGIGILEQPLPPAFQNTFALNAAWARDHVPGITSLANQTVMVLADGVVQGPFTLDNTGLLGPLSPPAVVMQIGIPYNADAELMDLAVDQTRSNQKTVWKATWEVVATRGLQAGPDFDHLVPAKLRDISDNFGPPAAVTQQVPVVIGSSWTSGARMVVRQSDPLPITIVAAIRELVVGGN